MVNTELRILRVFGPTAAEVSAAAVPAVNFKI